MLLNKKVKPIGLHQRYVPILEIWTFYCQGKANKHVANNESLDVDNLYEIRGYNISSNEIEKKDKELENLCIFLYISDNICISPKKYNIHKKEKP